MPVLKKLEKNEGDPKAQELMGQLDSNKMLLNIFRGMANSPAALNAYLALSGALKEGSLSAAEREAIALSVGQDNKCDYCLAAHTMIGKGAGLDDAAIRGARLGKDLADPRLAAIVSLSKSINDKRGFVDDAEVAAARAAGLTDGDIAEVVANVSLNLYTNYFNHINKTEVDLPAVPVEIS